MFVLKTDSGGLYFQRIATVMGQPMAQGCQTLDDARKFKTEAAARKFRGKWICTGVGMESFGVVFRPG